MLKFFCSLISLFLFLSCSHKKVETISLSKKEKIELNKFLMQEDQAGLNIVDDPFIRNLSKKLLAQNLSLKASSQKLLSLKKVMGISDSAFYPQLTASLSTTRSKSPSQFQKDPQNQATFSMAASYELDIWGRTKALSQSAYFDYGAAKLEYHAQKISLLAELHEQYFLFIKNQMHLRQIDKSLELAKEQKNILSLSFEEGLSQSIELLREDEFAAKLKAQKTLIISQKKTICYNIAVLLGDFNLLKNSNLKELEAKKLPPLLKEQNFVINTKNLMRRPDLRAAIYKVKAQDERVAAAILARLPNLRLGADLSHRRTGDNAVMAISGWAWNLMASLTGTLFDGGRKRFEIEKQKALLQNLVLNFKAALISAYKDALSFKEKELRQREYLNWLEIASQSSQKVMELTLERYSQGLEQYLRVVEARKRFVENQTSILEGKRSLLSARISLKRSLGGDPATPQANQGK